MYVRMRHLRFGMVGLFDICLTGPGIKTQHGSFLSNELFKKRCDFKSIEAVTWQGTDDPEMQGVQVLAVQGFNGRDKCIDVAAVDEECSVEDHFVVHCFVPLRL